MRTRTVQAVDRSLSPVFEGYLGRFDMALSDVAERSRAIYGRGARRFLHFLESDLGLVGVPLDSVTREWAREWVRSMETAGAAPATIRAEYSGARKLFAVLLEDGEVTANPFLGLRLAGVKMKEPTILTAAEVQALCDVAKREHSVWGLRDRAIIMCLYDGGFRRAELLDIHEGDIDQKTGAVLVSGKGSRERWVPLSPNAFRSLMQYLAARRKWVAGRKWYRQNALREASIWLSRRGDALEGDGLASLLKTRARQAGITKAVSPHCFRHSSATAQAGERVPEEELRAKFGWSPGSTMVHRYTRTSLAERAIEGHRRYGPANALKL